MPGMTTSPQLRESPETAKVHVTAGATGVEDWATAGTGIPQSVANTRKHAAGIVRRVIILICELPPAESDKRL